MNHIKIQLCREHWQQLPPHCKDRPTAKHLVAAVEIAERLLSENNKLESEARLLRLGEQPAPAPCKHDQGAYMIEADDIRCKLCDEYRPELMPDIPGQL